MNKKLILLVEDELIVQKNNTEMLEEEGFAVRTAMSLAETRAFLQNGKPDAIILDIGMPDGNGLDFLREFRLTSKIPVLLLTGFGEAQDIVSGFNSGCDDYLPKPYNFDVLLARLLRLLQSAEQVPETIVRGPLTLNLTVMAAYINEEDLMLTQKEFALLLLFAQNENRTIGAEYLYEKVWGHPMNDDTKAIKSQVSRLRRKLKGSGYTIPPARNEGYCFAPEKNI